jgi:hypothetical protein
MVVLVSGTDAEGSGFRYDALAQAESISACALDNTVRALILQSLDIVNKAFIRNIDPNVKSRGLC